MPAKKRKITVSKRSAFWPCGSCRQNCASGIQCDACKQWFHAQCQDLSEGDLNVLSSSTATYTCEDCFTIELGSSPYEYLYGLTRMRQVIIIKNCRCFPQISDRYILLRLDECWIHGEDILKCDTFFLIM